MDDATSGTLTWPTPKHTPIASGSQLNPDRVNFLVAAIRQELVLGEQCRLVEDLDVLEYLVEDKGDSVVAKAADLKDGFYKSAREGGMMVTSQGCEDMGDIVSALLNQIHAERLINAELRTRPDALEEAR